MLGLRLKLLFDSPAIYGRERRPPKTLAAARAAAAGGAAGFPGAEAPGYRNPNSRSTYLVDDHNRRAIERIECRSNYLVNDHKRRAIERIESRSNYLVDDHNRLAIRLNLKLAPFGSGPILAARTSMSGPDPAPRFKAWPLPVLTFGPIHPSLIAPMVSGGER